MQDYYKDESELQFIKFDFVTGGQEISVFILVELYGFWSLFCLFSSYFFSDGFFQFQDNKVSLKQAPGHNHENTIFQPAECLFNSLSRT